MANINFSDLDGSNGFVIYGTSRIVRSAGDINGDGIDDLIIKANGSKSYVVFGNSSGFGASFDLSSLNGSNGFVINGTSSSFSSAGDINGDGIDDLIIGANSSAYNTNNLNVGTSYVVFGNTSGFGAEFNLSDLNGSNGFTINGIVINDIDRYSFARNDVSSGGDINGDGFDDLIIRINRGAIIPGANANTYDPEETYVVFGSSDDLSAGFDLSTLNGSNGFVINGIDGYDRVSYDIIGLSVNNGGDINGDGFNDVIIKAPFAQRSYVVFGKSSGFSASLNVSDLDGSNGFTISGAGFSVANAGDFNGDGIDDLIVGAPFASPNGQSAAGQSYVVFGSSSGFSASLNVSDLDGSNGFAINGNDTSGLSGSFVGSAGDFNGDGFDDLIIGSSYMGIDTGVYGSQKTYVVFGSSSSFGAEFNLSDLNGTNGLVISGTGNYDVYSYSGAGDINGDGFDDVIVNSRFERSFVVFGFATPTTNQTPVGVNDTATTDEDTAVNISVLANDSDPDNDPLTVTAVNGNTIAVGTSIFLSSGAFLTLNADGTFTYNPNGQFDTLGVGENGSDSFTYTVSDGSFTSTATVNLTINGVNDAPTAVISNFFLSTLNGNNGFVINGINAGDYSGFSVSNAGDINGDGIDDLIIGAPNADPNGQFLAGESYVVFGSSSGFSASLDLSDLDGSNGFVINGIDAFDNSGFSVSNAGDINGDGIGDLIIGAPYADPNGQSSAGKSYVVFGSSSGFNGSFDLSSLDGSNGFVINGIEADDSLGKSVSSAGDINGDGIDDLIIGAPYADSNGQPFAGESYVVFGKSSGFSASFDLSSLDGSNGFVINGVDADRSGRFVSSAGDINGDGIDDLIIGAPYADSNGQPFAGESYVVFGKSSGFSATFNLSSLDGTNGFVINGVDVFDNSGRSASNGGDINGDGFDDLIIGAPSVNPTDQPYAGESYVVFGKSSGFSASFDLSSLDGSNGFVIRGIYAYDRLGFSVTGVGDINGDSFDDLIVGALDSDQAYVVFGKSSGFSASFNLSSLDGSNGFVIRGIDGFDRRNLSISGAGDINDDGIDDLIIGAPNASPNGQYNAGKSYVVFGFATAATTNEDTPINILANNILRRYTDINDGDTLSISAFTNASNGTLTLNDNGTPSVTDDDYFTYTPNANYSGTDSFSFTVSDGNGGSIDGSFNINIKPVNDAPIVANAIADITTTENSAFSFTFDADTFSDVDAGDTLTYTATLVDDSPLPDWLAFNANTRTFSGTPDDTDVGTISLKVIATDSSNASVSESFDLTVTPLNFTGTRGRDVLIGTASNNIIDGVGGNDELSGGAGNDILIGGTGSDVLTGGAGNDLFVYNSIRDAKDKITDFSPGADKIVLTDLFASFNLGSLNYETATAQGYLSFRSQGNNTAVLIDPDGLTGRAVAMNLLTVLDVSSNTLANADNFVF
ncbi:FG-GAP repeat protein [Nostoc sp. CENA67]|uniref:FG-GAP repeat protein n=1 Tax=Amazonocrinis nigriterrae CENA67 TaxID=2794033 RepID=A0A8J7L6K5_9NOST|nr:Ig-like domain-containing protein [Amazonocrinis nigriterrae]MBH8561383.1 FG-GAP repeat protein [Amazonocrinis nigriterrae CENA67]